MTQAAGSFVHTDGSPKAYLALLPENSENDPSQKIKKEEARRKKDEVGTRIKEHTYKTGGSYKREKSIKNSFSFCSKCHASVLGKCTTSGASFSIQKHRSLCLQKQKCFIIRRLLLTQNLNINAHLKLLLPATVSWSAKLSPNACKCVPKHFIGTNNNIQYSAKVEYRPHVEAAPHSNLHYF